MNEGANESIIYSRPWPQRGGWGSGDVIALPESPRMTLSYGLGVTPPQAPLQPPRPEVADASAHKRNYND